MATSTPPSNLLFTLSDDQRSATIGALGNPCICTPTLDGLVQRRFTSGPHGVA